LLLAIPALILSGCWGATTCGLKRPTLEHGWIPYEYLKAVEPVTELEKDIQCMEKADRERLRAFILMCEE
jgi:hypothetical protein